MGAFVIALKSVLPLFLVILSGVLFSRTRVATPAWIDILNKYALYIGLPALVIASMLKLEPEGQAYTRLILINSGYFVTSMLLAFPISWFFKFSNTLKRSLFLILSYGNVAYLGIPVLFSTYGDEVLPVASVIVAVYVFWLFTLGIFLIEFTGGNSLIGKRFLLKLLLNPLLISVFFGIFFVAFNLKLPEIVEKTIQLFSGSVTAVVLFSLGVFLGLHKIGRLNDWFAAILWSVIIMLVLPVAFYLIIKKAFPEPVHLKATILDSAMPLGLTGYALALEYKLEVPLVSRIVVVSTLIAVVIVPMWITILG